MNEDEREVIKAGAEAVVRPFADLIDKLFGGAAEQIGGIWEDSVAVERQIRRLRLFKKLQAAIDNAGFVPQRIPDAIWVPALREAVLQDDESLQERWANLLANAADPRQINPVRPSFSQILKEFTPLDAHFIEALYEQFSSPDHRFRRQFAEGFSLHNLSTIYDEINEGGSGLLADKREFISMLDVLARNGILRESTTPNPINVSKIVSDAKWTNNLPRSIEATATTLYHVTVLGTQFVKACQAPRSAPSD